MAAVILGSMLNQGNVNRKMDRDNENMLRTRK